MFRRKARSISVEAPVRFVDLFTGEEFDISRGCRMSASCFQDDSELRGEEFAQYTEIERQPLTDEERATEHQAARMFGIAVNRAAETAGISPGSGPILGDKLRRVTEVMSSPDFLRNLFIEPIA